MDWLESNEKLLAKLADRDEAEHAPFTALGGGKNRGDDGRMGSSMTISTWDSSGRAFNDEARPIEAMEEAGCEPEPGRGINAGCKVAKPWPQLAKGRLDEATEPGERSSSRGGGGGKCVSGSDECGGNELDGM